MLDDVAAAEMRREVIDAQRSDAVAARLDAGDIAPRKGGAAEVADDRWPKRARGVEAGA